MRATLRRRKDSMTDKVRQASIAAEQDGHHPLEDLFHHRSIAVVGASTRPNGAGNEFLRGFMKMNFPGPLYPINPKATEILSLKAYPSILDIEGPLDYVISSIPALGVPELIRQCAQKGVKLVHMFTAGFHESGEQDRAELEEEIARTGKEGGVRLLGPNCMGIYSPGTNLSWSPEFPVEPGSVGFISQSGANASDMVGAGGRRGLRFSKVISFGNALDINESDLMEYLSQDTETEMIAAYVEGIREGARFARALRDACRRKPVIVIKGGSTDEGRKAALSHTASLSGPEQIWRGLMKQSGAVSAASLEEMSDILMTFSLMPKLSGRNVALIGAGGGANVLACDAFSNHGFRIPTFNNETQKKLRQFIPLSGTWVVNPVDFSPQTAGDPVLTSKAIEIMANVKEIDVIILHYMVVSWGMGGGDRAKDVAGSVSEVSKRIKKPLAVVLETHGTPDICKTAYEIKLDWIKAGMCVYPDIERAAICLGKLARYHGIF